MQWSAKIMSFINSVPFVQNEYPDYHGRGYPGQFFRLTDAWNDMIESFPVEADTSTVTQFVYCGRIVVQSTAQDATDGTLPVSAPFSVRAPIATDLTAAGFAGVVLRSFIGNVNSSAEEGQRKAGFPEKTIAPIVPFGKGIILLVRLAPGLSVTYGDDVYAATTNIAGPPTLYPGEFSNADGGNPNLVQVPNAIWYTTKTGTQIDQIGAIQFN